MADKLSVSRGSSGFCFKRNSGLRIHKGKTAFQFTPTRKTAYSSSFQFMPTTPISLEKDTLCVECGCYFKGYRGLRTHQGKAACGYSLPSKPQNIWKRYRKRGPQLQSRLDFTPRRDDTKLSQSGHRYDFMFDHLPCILMCCLIFLFLLLIM